MEYSVRLRIELGEIEVKNNTSQQLDVVLQNWELLLEILAARGCKCYTRL